MVTGAAEIVTITASTTLADPLLYSLTVTPTPNTPGLITIDSASGSITFAASSNLLDAKTYTLVVSASQECNVPTTATSAPATYTYVNDPCPSATITWAAPPGVTTSVLVGSSTPVTRPYDSVSGSASP